MADTTTNYGLIKPSYEEDADISVLNANADIIDSKMKEIADAGGGGSGNGDMLKSVYDTDGDGKVDSANNADTVGGFTVGVSVPANAKFTDTNTTYSEITTDEIDAGTASTLRTVTARRLKYAMDKVQTEAGGSDKKASRFIIGTSTSSWTAKDCDYLCDGTADDVEINAAIQALPANGGEIVILDGTYNITAQTLINKNNVKLKGNGSATIFKRGFDNVPTGVGGNGVIKLQGVEGCAVEDLQVDGNKAVCTSENNYGIYLSSSNDNTITGNTCNNNSRGIYLSSSNDNTITGNTCNNNSRGIYLSLSSSNNTVTGNACRDNDYGIHLFSSNNNTVIGNTCRDNDYGIRLFSSNNNTVIGNTCRDNDYGIRLFSSNNNTITGNTCMRGTGLSTDYTSSQYTIYLYDTSNNYNLISSNNCMGKAVVIDGGTGNTNINNKWNESDDIQDIKASLDAKFPISGGVLENYREKLVILSNGTINLNNGNVFSHAPSASTTYSITNAGAGAHSFTLIITQPSTAVTLTFPASVKWQGGTIPDMTAADKTYVLTFLSVDSGTTWLGMFGGEF